MKTKIFALFLGVCVTLHAAVSGSSLVTVESVSGGVRSIQKVTLTSIGSTMSWSPPTGVIVMWSGTIATIPSGWALCDGTGGTPNLVNSFVKGVATSVTNPGGTGGAATHAPAGTNSALTFTGASGSTSSDSAGTPAGTNANESAHTHSVTSNVSGTLTPAGTVAWPAGVPTAANESAHTHAVTQSAITTTKFTTNASGSAAYTGGGVVTTPTGAGSAHTHTLSWPAGVPTFTGSTNQAVTMANPAVTSAGGSAHAHTFTGSALSGHSHTVTPSGTINTPVFTGSSANTEPVYYAVAFIIKT